MLDELLALTLSPPSGTATPADIDALHRRLGSEDGVAEAALAYLASDASAAATSLFAVRLLRADIARGVSPGGRVLAQVLSRHFASDERLVELRLRYLMGLGRRAELLTDLEAVVARDFATPLLAYQVFLCLNRTARETRPDLFRRAVLRLHEIAAEAGDGDLWLGRFHREMENDAVAVRYLLTASESLPAGDRHREVALREAAELAVRSGRWGRDAPALLAAWRRTPPVGADARQTLVAKVLADVGAAADLDAEAHLPGTRAYSHLYAGVGTPEIAFDYLLDQILPERRAYVPADTLLMFGTSLSGGGMERIFAASYRAVAASGAFARVRLALLTFEPGQPTAFYLPECGARAEDIEVLSFAGAPGYPASLLPLGLGRRVWQAYEIIVRERPRIIHAWNDMPGAVAAFAGLLAGCPRIFIHFHHMRAINLTRDRTIMRSFPACFRRLLERPEIELLFVSDAAAEDYADWWSVARTAKLRRLLNGFPMADEPLPDREAARRTLGLPLHAPVVGTVFRFHSVKRPFMWIEAARRIHAALPVSRFVMVGDGDLWEAAKARVAELGLRDAFHFPGRVRNVTDYLAAFDLFMLTSKVEGLPNSLIEAQIAGVPVVTTDAGGARETFSPGRTGRLVTDATPEAMAEAVMSCLADPVWLGAAGPRSREEARATFGLRPYLARLLSLYAEPSHGTAAP